MIIKNKNLHFDNKQDNHMSSENHEENSCDLDTNLLIVSTNRMFNILGEAGVDFRPTYITAHLHYQSSFQIVDLLIMAVFIQPRSLHRFGVYCHLLFGVTQC